MNSGVKRLVPERDDTLLHELQVHQVELESQNIELRRIQIELDLTRARYFDLYNLAPVGYFTISESEIILEANLTAASLLGLHVQALVGTAIQKYILPADQDIYYHHRRKLTDTGLPQNCELRLGRLGSVPFWAQLISTCDHAATEPLVHRLVVSNIDERKQLEQALKLKNLQLHAAISMAEKANQAKSEFLSSMSHDLRSPLNAILGFAQLLEASTPAPTPIQQKNIDRILAGGWYLLKLINEILDLALIESGKLAMSLQALSLGPLLLECQHLTESQADKHAVRMHFPAMESPVGVIADPVRLKQVVINLLSNAIKYNRPGGTVEVNVQTPRQDYLRIGIKDTGAGLSAHEVTELFSAFNRLGRDTGTIEGTGIGLVVTKKLTELMGGTIGVTSTVGVGSEFWVEFKSAPTPVTARSPAYPALHARGVPLIGQSLSPCTVLYIEDSPANVDLVAQILARRSNLQLHSASNGPQGIALAHQYAPDVILMDIHLPGMSGLEVLRQLRRDVATQHIPVVAVSANAMPPDIVNGLSAGFFRYLTKPFQIEHFWEVLDQALELRSATARVL